MNYQNKAVLFDLDGTLIDTAPDFIRIIKKMCQDYNHPCPTDNAIREQVSAGATAMTGLIFADTLKDDPKLMAYRQIFLNEYEQDICVDSQLFDGLDNLLTCLDGQGILWGIVTNKPRHLTMLLLDKLQLSKRCKVVVCPDDVQHTKPDPEPLFLAVERLNQKFGTNIDAKNCVYVGDHIRDIQAGNRADMTTVVAKYGYIPKDTDVRTWGADRLVDTPDELAKFLINWLGLNI